MGCVCVYARACVSTLCGIRFSLTDKLFAPLTKPKEADKEKLMKWNDSNHIFACWMKLGELEENSPRFS